MTVGALLVNPTADIARCGALTARVPQRNVNPGFASLTLGCVLARLQRARATVLVTTTCRKARGIYATVSSTGGAWHNRNPVIPAKAGIYPGVPHGRRHREASVRAEAYLYTLDRPSDWRAVLPEFDAAMDSLLRGNDGRSNAGARRPTAETPEGGWRARRCTRARVRNGGMVLDGRAGSRHA